MALWLKSLVIDVAVWLNIVDPSLCILGWPGNKPLLVKDSSVQNCGLDVQKEKDSGRNCVFPLNVCKKGACIFIDIIL